MKLVTKEKLISWVIKGTPTKTPKQVVGWAINAIYENQRADEKASAVTVYANGIGFTQSDARVGSVTAKQYLQYGEVSDKLFALWTARTKTHTMRLLKYANQLNDIANQKQNETKTKT